MDYNSHSLLYPVYQNDMRVSCLCGGSSITSDTYQCVGCSQGQHIGCYDKYMLIDVFLEGYCIDCVLAGMNWQSPTTLEYVSSVWIDQIPKAYNLFSNVAPWPYNMYGRDRSSDSDFESNTDFSPMPQNAHERTKALAQSKYSEEISMSPTSSEASLDSTLKSASVPESARTPTTNCWSDTTPRPTTLLNAKIKTHRPSEGAKAECKRQRRKRIDRTRKHRCTLCHKSFVERHHLLSHISGHTEERSFACVSCPKTFKRPADRNRHEKLHSGERPHGCLLCYRTFARKDALIRHNTMCSRNSWS